MDVLLIGRRRRNKIPFTLGTRAFGDDAGRQINSSSVAIPMMVETGLPLGQGKSQKIVGKVDALQLKTSQACLELGLSPVGEEWREEVTY